MNKITTMAWVSSLAFVAFGATIPAAVSVYVSPEELSARAPIVVEALVVETRSGLDPDRGTLNTYITLDIDHVHRGPADLREVTLREPGGRWGDLVHELDAVPVYLAGERVIAYLEPGSDGALRTVGMFFGKFRLEETRARGPLMATRDLDGQGTILFRSNRSESLTRNDLVALTAGIPQRRASDAWSAQPPEWGRLEWDGGGAAAPRLLQPVRTANGGVDIRLLRPSSSRSDEQFVATEESNPARWIESDSGTPILVHVEPAGNPMNDDQAAVGEIARALAAWTDVPQSRLHLGLGNVNYDYTGRYASPTSTFSGVNIVLFGDPYNDISDPTQCSGVLAIGGYWRDESIGAPVNQVSFHRALQMYVIFNNNFECFLGNPENLAEVATHEIGHGLGFGHSNVADSIMRSSAYGNRGPRLGNDDIDAAHCHYPHTMTLVEPNGGVLWNTGESETIAWNVTPEVGSDSGTVDLEYTTDDGASWKPIAAGTANDGSYEWSVADDPAPTVTIRVVRHILGTMVSSYPNGCSSDLSDGALSIGEAPTTPDKPSARRWVERFISAPHLL